MKMVTVLSILLLGVSLNAHAVFETDKSQVDEVGKLKDKAYCKTQVYLGTLPVIENKPLEAKTKLGCYDNFTLLHSGLSRTALWSAEHLTRESVLAASKIKRVNPFHAEERLPIGERAELANYARTGFDRGHLAPNKDMSTEMAQYQCFTLANMIPQNPNNNRVLWEGIEAATRTLAKEEGDIYVVTGPLFLSTKLESLSGVLKPTHIFKAIFDPVKHQAAAYLVANAEGMDYKVINIDELKRLSGINVFPFLEKAKSGMAASLPKPTPHNEKNAE